MAHPEYAPESPRLTVDYIAEQTGLVLRASYDPYVCNYPPTKKAFMEHLGNLQRTHGIDNVITSFYENPNQEMRLGIFANEDHSPSPEQERVDAEAAARLMTQETVVLGRVELDPEDSLYR